MHSHKKLFVSIFISLICLLALPLIVQADHRTINTSDGLVDPGWATAVSVIDGADYSDPNWDIEQAWVTNEANKSYFYFRVKLYGRMPANDWSGVEALLDCNSDGDVADAGDVIIYFVPTSPTGSITGACQGNNWPTTCDDFFYGSNSEIIGSGPTDYEWKAPTTGAINYSACMGNIKVGVRTTYMENFSVYQFRDITAWRSFNTPTQITVNSFTAKDAAGPLALLGGSGVLALAVFALRRPRK
jgi:hypothetical protein